jgi:hypothetical protein
MKRLTLFVGDSLRSCVTRCARFLVLLVICVIHFVRWGKVAFFIFGVFVEI